MLRAMRYSVIGITFALVMAGCDTVDPDQLLAPSPAALTAASRPRPLEAITTTGLQQIVTVQKVISHQGGTMLAGPHALIVPAGATDKPTLFVMRVLPGPGVRVKLTAYQMSGGDLTPISSFDNPIQLRLSYDGVTVTDPARLQVFYCPEGFIAEYPVPSTVDTVEKTVTGLLHHFSDYSMGEA